MGTQNTINMIISQFLVATLIESVETTSIFKLFQYGGCGLYP